MNKDDPRLEDELEILSVMRKNAADLTLLQALDNEPDYPPQL